MKTKVLSVRLKSFSSISDKAYKAVSFDGSECILPKSQVFGQDYEVKKSDAYWISEWILQQKEIQYSCKKVGWYNPKTAMIEPNITIEHHKPKKVEFNPNSQPNASLIK